MNAVNLDVKITSCINIVKQYPKFVATCIIFGYYDEKWIFIGLWHSFLFAPPRPSPSIPSSKPRRQKIPPFMHRLEGGILLFKKDHARKAENHELKGCQMMPQAEICSHHCPHLLQSMKRLFLAVLFFGAERRSAFPVAEGRPPFAFAYGHVSEKMKQDSANRMEAYMQHTICGKKLQNG